MLQQTLKQKLEILADAAKYDASCGSIDADDRGCGWWLEAERAVIKPHVVLALGASAARGLTIALDDGSELWITAHPSYLLRLDGAAGEEQAAWFAADLEAVKARTVELAK